MEDLFTLLVYLITSLHDYMYRKENIVAHMCRIGASVRVISFSWLLVIYSSGYITSLAFVFPACLEFYCVFRLSHIGEYFGLVHGVSNVMFK